MTAQDDALRDAQKQAADMYLAGHLEKHDMERQTADTALRHNMERLADHQESHDQAHDAHLAQHTAEGMAVQTALEAKILRDDDHRAAHDRDHVGHTVLHEKEAAAVVTALEAVARERTIHADAHEREHIAHNQVHDLAQRAVDKAEAAVETRLHLLNEVRDQLREQAVGFVLRAEAVAKWAQAEKNHDDLLVLIATEREERRANEGSRKGISASMGWIIAAIGAVGTILGIMIVLANVLTTTP